MFERYTERARRVLFFGRYEASQFGSLSIDTEHLLLGLLREGKGLTSRVFADARVSLEDVRQQIEAQKPRGEKTSTSVEIPFSLECKRVLQFAAEEADRLLHDYIGTEHLLLGLLRDPRTTAGSILMGRGLRLDAVREQIVTLVNAGRRADDAPGPVAQRPGDPGLPQFVPSTIVHIMYSGRGPSIRKTPREWIALGHSLRRIAAEAWHVEEHRVDIPAASAGARYDVVLTLPHEEDRQTMEMLVRQAIEQQLGVIVSTESRATDVFLVTAPAGPGHALRQHSEPEGGGAGMVYARASTAATNQPGTPMLPLEGLSLSAVPMPMLCQMLEELLGRPVVDQTGLRGVFDLELKDRLQDRDALLAALRDRAGLALTLEHREVEMLVVRSR